MDTRLALVITTALILSNAHTSWANEIYISQIGDDLTLVNISKITRQLYFFNQCRRQ